MSTPVLGLWDKQHVQSRVTRERRGLETLRAGAESGSLFFIIPCDTLHSALHLAVNLTVGLNYFSDSLSSWKDRSACRGLMDPSFLPEPCISWRLLSCLRTISSPPLSQESSSNDSAFSHDHSSVQGWWQPASQLVHLLSVHAVPTPLPPVLHLPTPTPQSFVKFTSHPWKWGMEIQKLDLKEIRFCLKKKKKAVWSSIL